MTALPISSRQRAHAQAMVNVVAAEKLPKRAAVVVMETALVESSLTIYANGNVPESMKIPHEDVGYDHASVGILQQQVPSWGTAADCMDPARATHKFLYGAGTNPGLLTLPAYRFKFVNYPSATRWDQIPTGSAAQAVQVSGFPDRYQQRESAATAIVNALWPTPPVASQEDEMIVFHDAGLPDGRRGLSVLVTPCSRTVLTTSASAKALYEAGAKQVTLLHEDYIRIRAGAKK